MKMPANSTYFTLATQRKALDVNGWFPEKMGLSVAATICSGDLRKFTEKETAQLAEILNGAEQIIGYNLFGFDLRVLEPYDIHIPATKCLDLTSDLESITGRRHSLQSVYAATFNEDLARNGLDMVKA